MKKRILSCLLCVLILFAALVVPASAITPIDPTRPSSLTLQYTHGGKFFEGVEVKTYRIAKVFEDGTYELTGDFAGYPVKIYEVTSQSEWRAIASTLAAYAEADAIKPTYTSFTDKDGIVAFENILPGMYLTLAVSVHDGKTVILFETFLTVVPYPSDDGNHNYDVTAFPKSESYTSEGDVEYKVIKLWKDEGATANRPGNVIVDILKDGILMYTKLLSSENGWTYSWTVPADGAIWTAVEREVEESYTVTTVREGNTFVITNDYDNDIPGPPQTGETPVITIAAIAMCLSGGVMILLAVWRKKSES